MIVVPLGVASATPTAVRHLPSVALWREGSVFLFDCGENSQMRMLQAGIKRSKIEAIFISHFDVDHFSGLLGLLATLQLQRRDKPLAIIGPKGIKEYVEWNLKFSKIDPVYEINFHEIEEDIEEERVFDAEEYYVEARPLNHTKFCVGFRFQEKDRPGKVDADKAKKMGVSKDEQYKELKDGNDVTLEDGTVVKSQDIVGHPRPGDSFAYVTDTEYAPNAVKLAMNTNILYHEATFGKDLDDKASETGHSSTADAARVATEAQTKLLVIGHFSARYTNAHDLLKEAREGFYPAWLANELRPIFTDPTHERGIITPKVEITELDNKSGGGKSNYKGRKNHKSGGKKNFRSRKGGSSSRSRSSSRDSRSGSSRDSRGSSGSSRSGSNSGKSGNYKRKTYGSSTYSSNIKSKKDDSDSSSSSPRKITPRSSYDDFDRF
ncbi:MAG: ribonuclease Z [Balneola sp.]|jgi:ribonuclease Z|nr:ribonuclease Z [Balneola sp.]MBE79430.1 ribonuclease Z [Balneola sp.]HBX67584.1 ribonuclease Z [Balneolaceae bacterium]|tara:strand:+ start:62672 stop:63976 length:1305 start_codon:yes stop_codon:yes gene_type:complete